MAKGKKGVATDELARMVERGFAAGAESMGQFRKEVAERFEGIDRRLDDMDNRFDGIDRRLESLELEIREVKNILGPLARTVSLMEVDIHTLYSRVSRLEKKVGIAK
jgi:archaellum component FlaC